MVALTPGRLQTRATCLLELAPLVLEEEHVLKGRRSLKLTVGKDGVTTVQREVQNVQNP